MSVSTFSACSALTHNIMVHFSSMELVASVGESAIPKHQSIQMQL